MKSTITEPEYLLYAERWRTHLAMSGIVQEKLLFPRLRYYLGDLTEQTVLDVGCGNGWSTQLLIQSKALNIVAMDINDILLKEAKEKLGENAQFVRLNFGDSLPYSSGSFDTVLCNLVFMNVDDIVMETVLRESSRILTNGGRLIISIVHPLWYLFVSQKTSNSVKRKLISYADTEQIPTNSLPDTNDYQRYRRSLGTYSLALKSAGFLHFFEEIYVKDFAGIPSRYKDRLKFPLFALYIGVSCKS